MNEDVCPICLDKLEGKPTYKIQCGHSFHTDCIMKWFRSSSGNCPCCLDNPNNNKKIYQPIFYGYWNIKFIESRCNVIKKYNQKNPGNIQMDKKFEKLKKYKDEFSELKNEKKEFLNNPEVKEIKKREKDINRKFIRKGQQIKKLKINIVTRYPMIRF
jgi:hypothetical protein